MPVKIHRHVGEITGAVARLAKKALPGLPSLKFRVLRSTLLSVRRVVGYFQEPSFLESDWRTTASIGQIHLACRQDQETGRSILPNDRLCRRAKGSCPPMGSQSVSQSLDRRLSKMGCAATKVSAEQQQEENIDGGDGDGGAEDGGGADDTIVPVSVEGDATVEVIPVPEGERLEIKSWASSLMARLVMYKVCQHLVK